MKNQKLEANEIRSIKQQSWRVIIGGLYVNIVIRKKNPITQILLDLCCDRPVD